MVFSFSLLLLAGADVYSVVDPPVTGVYALVFTNALAGTHALASVSSAVVSTIA